MHQLRPIELGRHLIDIINEGDIQIAHLRFIGNSAENNAKNSVEKAAKKRG